MADLVLYVKDYGTYENGDVIQAFSTRRVQYVHAQENCVLLNRDGVTGQFILNGSNLITPNSLDNGQISLLEDYCIEAYEYKLARVSFYEAVMTHKDGREIQIRTGKEFLDFDGKPSKMHVREYFERRMKAQKEKNARGIPMFGVDESKPWCYRGQTDGSIEMVGRVWDKIELKTPKRRDDAIHAKPDLGEVTTRTMLGVNTIGMTDQEAKDLMQPVYELDQNGNPVYYAYTEAGNEVLATLDDQGNPIGEYHFKQLKKRAIMVDWENELLGDLGVTKEQVRDRTFRVGKEVLVTDFRNKLYQSIEQPPQASRAKLQNKITGQRVPDANNN